MNINASLRVWSPLSLFNNYTWFFFMIISQQWILLLSDIEQRELKKEKWLYTALSAKGIPGFLSNDVSRVESKYSRSLPSFVSWTLSESPESSSWKVSLKGAQKQKVESSLSLARQFSGLLMGASDLCVCLSSDSEVTLCPGDSEHQERPFKH